MASKIRYLALSGVILGGLMGGCAATQSRLAPEELFNLAVSGLAAQDSYSFSGATTLNSSLQKKEFKGEVRRHEGIRLLETGEAGNTLKAEGEIPAGYNPAWLLARLLDEKAVVALDEAKSEGGKAVLIISPKPKEAGAMWRSRLETQWQQIEKSSPGMSDAWRQLDGSGKARLQKEWNQELESSASQWKEMMDSLTASSSYTLVIDRSRLVPLKLIESSKLHYRSQGNKAEEQRNTEFNFHLSR